MNRALVATLIVAVNSLQYVQSSVSDERQPSTPPLPAEMVKRIQMHLQKQFPDGKISLNDGKKFEYRWHCHDYLIHPPADRHAESFRGSERVSGPGDDGFQLYLEWREDYDDSGSGQLETFGYLEPEEYWRVYKNVYRMPEKQGVIWMKFDAGRAMDEKLLNDIRKELEAVGRPKAKLDQVEEKSAWNDDTAPLRAELIKVMVKHQIPCTWKQLENGAYVLEVKPKVFDIHEVSEAGVVSPEAHKVTGPDVGGVIVKLTRISKLPVNCQPQPRYGKIERWYWTQYFEMRDVWPNRRIDLLYSKVTDRKLLTDIIDAVRIESEEPSRF